MKTEIFLSIIDFNLSWIQFILILIGTLILVQIIRSITRKNNKEEQDILDAWHNDPANWKAGIFYYNPKDKRLFPPKRISGMGWTINFANPTSVIALITLVIFIMIALHEFNQWM